ncbi:outer membrane protein [Bradyrhizobium sp. STM 3562]|uniref:outer membrane protein n=1 Tax=Bradyrhizobium sp. STM 3562 TaxID=578924 RepID=UPI0038900CA2
MRSVKFLIAAGAASLLSTAAFAADMPIAPPPMYAPPPPADFGGWYLRGDIGFSNQSVKDVKLSNPAAYQGLSSFNQTTDFDTAGTYQIGVGYQFNNWFRADITGQYRGKSNFKGTDLVTFPWGVGTASGSDFYNASKSELLFLANVYADLGTWWCVTPFIGAGIGASRVTISNFTDSGLTNANFTAAGVPVVSGPPISSFATAASGSKWNFAWALHAGLGYKVMPNVTLELAYSYVNLGDGVTGVASTFDGSSGGHVFNFRNITSNDVKLGVRWDLDTPPPPPPPPLIRKG